MDIQNVRNLIKRSHDMVAAKPYSCNGCTKCCGPVPMSRMEAEGLGLDQLYTRAVGPHGDTCEFADEVNGRCTVYENRPFICRMFNAPFAGAFKCMEIPENGMMKPDEAFGALMFYVHCIEMEGCLEEFLEGMDRTYEIMTAREKRMGWNKGNMGKRVG